MKSYNMNSRHCELVAKATGLTPFTVRHYVQTGWAPTSGEAMLIEKAAERLTSEDGQPPPEPPREDDGARAARVSKILRDMGLKDW